MLRLVTYTLAGEAYLTFMGNEFGHPEWVDFPREGNGWSHQYARRQWSLVDNQELRYRQLGEFDSALLGETAGLLSESDMQVLNVDVENKCLQIRRGPWVIVANFHPDRSIYDYRFILD